MTDDQKGQTDVGRGFSHRSRPLVTGHFLRPSLFGLRDSSFLVSSLPPCIDARGAASWPVS